MKCDICRNKFKEKFMYVRFVDNSVYNFNIKDPETYNMTTVNIQHYEQSDNYGLYLCSKCHRVMENIKVPKHIPEDQSKRYILALLKKGNNGYTIRKDTASSIT